MNFKNVLNDDAYVFCCSHECETANKTSQRKNIIGIVGIFYVLCKYSESKETATISSLFFFGRG